MISDKAAVMKGKKPPICKKKIFDLTPFGSLPSENSFKENVFRLGISNKRMKSLHFVKINI
jgi:hypothetical protein